MITGRKKYALLLLSLSNCGYIHSSLEQLVEFKEIIDECDVMSIDGCELKNKYVVP
jgi:hypothetical protein